MEMSETSLNGTLVVGPAWVGDMVMAQSLFKHLRDRWPDRDIDVLAPAATVQLVSRMPEVSMGILLKQEHGQLGLGYRKRLGNSLRGKRYRQAIVLPNSLKSALVPFFADIPERTGFRGEYRYALLNDMRMLDENRLPKMVERFLALGVGVNDPLPPIQYPALMTDETNLADVVGRLRLDLSRPVLGLCPGAEFGDAKRWPERHYAALALYAIRKGMNVWLLGGPKDRVISGTIASMVKEENEYGITDLAGQTSLMDAVDLLGACSLVVSNDSGLMHIAAAVGVPIVVVYGSTSPQFTPPLSDLAMIVSEKLECSPCFKRTCPLGHKNCLNQLVPGRIEPVVDRYCGGATL